MQKLVHSFGYLISGLSAVGSICLALMVLIVVVDLALRQIGGYIPGAISFEGILQAFIVFFGFAQAQANKEHIQVDLFINKLLPYGGILRRYWDVVIYVMAIIFFGIIFWESIDSFKVSYQIKEFYGGSTVRVPLYPARGALTVGCFLMIIQLIKDAIHGFTGRNKV